MKILQIASGDFFSTYGGGQVYVKNMVDAFIDLKFNSYTKNDRNNKYNKIDLSVISFNTTVSKPQLKNYKGIILWEVPINLSEENFSELISKIKPNIIHAHSYKATTSKIGKRLNIPTIVTAHHGGIYCPSHSRIKCNNAICYSKINFNNCVACILKDVKPGLQYLKPILKLIPPEKIIKFGKFISNQSFVPFLTPISSIGLRIENHTNQWNDIINNCSLIISPCEEISKAMLQNGLPKNKSIILPHGIRLPKNRPPYPEIIGDNIKFFYVGRIEFGKGIHILLKALSQISNKEIELHLIGSSGTNKEFKYFKKLKSIYKNDNRIIWHGKMHPDDIYDLIKGYHVAVSPSFLETYGLNIAEALAMGKPVLSTKNGGSEIQIKEGKNGWLIPRNDVNSLRIKIEYIIKNKNYLKEMSKNCNANSIEKHIISLIELYKTLID